MMAPFAASMATTLLVLGTLTFTMTTLVRFARPTSLPIVPPQPGSNTYGPNPHEVSQ